MVMAWAVKSGGPMWWIVGLLLMGVFGRALAQDNARHHGPIAQGRKGDRVAEDGWQRMAADTHRSHVYRVSVQRKSGSLIMGRRCQPTVLLRVYQKDVRIALGCHTPIIL